MLIKLNHCFFGKLFYLPTKLLRKLVFVQGFCVLLQFGYDLDASIVFEMSIKMGKAANLRNRYFSL